MKDTQTKSRQTIYKFYLRGVFSFVVVCMFCASTGLFVPTAIAQELSQDEKNALEKIQQGRVITTISFLASDELEGRGTPSNGYDVACAYVAARFRGAGLEGIGDDGSFYQSTTYGESETPVRNVVGVLKGSDPDLSSEAIIISAHLDHLGKRDMEGDNIFNGADDNATGVTGVLSLADAFAALPESPKRTLVFVAFWGEERGLLGAKHMVKNTIWPLDKIVANINLEMIGRPEPGARNKCWMTGWEQSDLGSLMADGAKRVDVEIFDHPQFGSRLYRASDNWEFVKAGVIAHSFSAGSLHSDYHQPGDEWEKLEVAHMTKVIQGLFAATLPLAQGEVTPTKSEKGR